MRRGVVAAAALALAVLAMTPAGAFALSFYAPSDSAFSTGGDTPDYLTAEDVNADSNPDLIALNRYSRDVAVLLGDGTGDFIPASGSPFSVGSGPDFASWLAVADFNGDSRPDIATANDYSDSISVLLGDGTGGFTLAPGNPFPAGGTPTTIAAGDFNDDSDPDLAITRFAGCCNELAILVGGPGASFSEAAGSPYRVGAHSTAIAMDDFNGDSDPDLAIVDRPVNSVSVWVGGSGASFTQVTAVRPAGALTVADVNGDSDPDLAVADGYFGSTNPPITLHLGGPGGSFAAAPDQIPTTDHPIRIADGDFNGDSDPDLIVLYRWSGATIWLGGPGAGFAEAAGNPFGSPGDARSVTVADLNRDGRPDYAVATGFGYVTVQLQSRDPTSLSLSPKTGTNDVDDLHCVTATVRDAQGATPGVHVIFTVDRPVGTYKPREDRVTDRSGEARTCISGPRLGPITESIHAFADFNRNGEQDPGEPSDSGEQSWVLPANGPPCQVTQRVSYRAPNGEVIYSFAGNARIKPNGKLSGWERYHDFGPERVSLRSTRLTGLVCSPDGGFATIFGEGSVNGSPPMLFRFDLNIRGRWFFVLLETGYGGYRTFEGDARIKLR